LLYQYGKILGKTHETTTFSHYGILGERNGELKVTEKRVRWPWSIWGTLRVWDEMIMNGWENPPEKELLPDKGYVEKTLPAKPESVIIHDDNSFENLKVEYDTIEALLDWAHTRAGHGEYDLVKAEYSLIDWYLRQNSVDKNRLRKALYKGYRKHREIKEDGFEERKKLYRYFTVIWLCAGFPNWSSEMDEEQRNRIREDLINRLEKEKPS